jgi:glycosyltransferase involved in cell wall biosynthesis
MIVLDILFIAPLPPPTTGQSVACKVFYDDILRCGHKIRLIDISKGTFKQGFDSIRRVFEVIEIFKRVITNSAAVDLIYITPSESIAGNLKDIFLYALLWRKLHLTHLHLHGGGGMREILSRTHPILRWLNSIFIKRMASVIVLGDRHVSIYKEIIAENRIKVVKNFAPDDSFASDEEFEEKWKKIDPLRVLFLSNLIPGKGYEFLSQAIRSLAPDVARKYFFHFAGGFESESDKSIFLRSISRCENIKYHGTILGQEKRELLQSAHILCLPSYLPEGQPISILEAYAAGCAVITTDCGGIFDIFTPEENGFEVELNSWSSIAHILSTAALMPAKLNFIALKNMHVARLKFRRGLHLENMRENLRILPVSQK